MKPKLNTKKYDNIWLGIFGAVILTLLTLVIFYHSIDEKFTSIQSFINYMRLTRMFSAIISLCALPNLLLFFVFIWTKRYRTARGVLTIVMFLTLFVAYLKFS